ncbi:class I SAM-dependent methyltransferase [Marinibactrum halimedae]|uniref:Methyltransferase n=1 Tax=Marinibactrum halimedae TaxID=1444977 RepID=A0AA37WPS0_9GAMM|nr:methyltransferase [Marinibactrum halimedae]MCD9458533.1 methyltransferase [Marinibactrum halimedae]GLS26602.1 methyltransferase [Marinibactrum halimedae]
MNVMIKTMMMTAGVAVLSSAMTLPAWAGKMEPKATIEKALKADVRTDKERKRDAERLPLETLTYFGLEPDMTVIELMPGRGWYTKILGDALKDEGKLYVALGLGYLGDGLKEWGYDHVGVLAKDAKFTRTERRGVSDLENVKFGVKKVDMVLTFRNAHNISAEGRANLNKAVFKALKKGGVYGIVDHTRRHMEADNADNWRRADPVQIIKEALDAGFVFEGYTDMHAQSEDTLAYDTRDERMKAADSDRFTLKFRKPK